MNVAENDDKHPIIWWEFMTVPMESAVFIWKNYLDNCHSITNTKRPHTQTNVRHICKSLWTRWDLWNGNNWLGKSFMEKLGDERVVNVQRTKVYVFSDSILCLGKIHENTQSNGAWEQRLGWLNSSPESEVLTESTASQWNSSGIFSQDSIRCSSVKKSTVYCWDWMRHQRILMSMFNDISCGSRDNEKRMRVKCSTRFSIYKEIWSKTMVISWSWFRENVLLHQCR